MTAFKPVKFRTTEEARIIRTILKHYFPTHLGGTRRKAKREEPGVTLNEAIKRIREHCAKVGPQEEVSLRAKVHLSGEKYDKSL